MDINRAAFGALALAGVVAAGGGAYLANRHNQAEVAQPGQVYAAAPEGAVTETENTIAPVPAASLAPAPAVVEPETQPAPARATRRAQAPARTAPAAPQRTRTSPSYGGNSAPSSAPSYNPPSAPVADSPVASANEPFENTVVERAPIIQEPPRKTYDELVIPADSVIGLQVETAVTTERAKIEDPVRARVTRDVKVRDQVAIPAGARA